MSASPKFWDLFALHSTYNLRVLFGPIMKAGMGIGVEGGSAEPSLSYTAAVPSPSTLLLFCPSFLLAYLYACLPVSDNVSRVILEDLFKSE